MKSAEPEAEFWRFFAGFLPPFRCVVLVFSARARKL